MNGWIIFLIILLIPLRIWEYVCSILAIMRSNQNCARLVLGIFGLLGFFFCGLVAFYKLKTEIEILKKNNRMQTKKTFSFEVKNPDKY